MSSDKLLERAAEVVARYSLRLQPHEKAVLVTDIRTDADLRRSLQEGLAATGARVGVLVVDFEQGNAAQQIAECELLGDADAVVAASSRSLSYDRTIALVPDRGGRFLSMPHISREVFERLATTDVEGMMRHTNRLLERFAPATSLLELRSPSGTRLAVDISGCRAHATDGVVLPGERDQLPAGVVSVVGRHARGEVVITGPLTVVDRLDAPIRLRIDDSTIVAIEGGEAAAQMAAVLDSYQERAAVHHCPCEIGIGTNPSVEALLGDLFIPELARALGMVHVGFGDDHLLPGGSVLAPIHGDFLLPDVEVWLDGVKVQVGL